MYSTILNSDNNNNKMFREQQISVLEWFLKGHVTPKTGGNNAENLALITEISYMLKYIKIENSYFKWSNISQYYWFCCILDQLNVGLVSRREL